MQELCRKVILNNRKYYPIYAFWEDQLHLAQGFPNEKRMASYFRYKMVETYDEAKAEVELAVLIFKSSRNMRAE